MSSIPLAGTVSSTEVQASLLERALSTFIGCECQVSQTIEEHRPAKGRAAEISVSWTSAETERLLENRGYSQLYRFAVLPSRRRPKWILPDPSGRRGIDGFQLYVPYSRAARWAKVLVVRMRAMGWGRWFRHHLLIASQRALPIEGLVRETTGEAGPVFSLSLGTPGTFQKLTVQVMRDDGSILGYVKMPLTDAAEKRLRHEAGVIEKLRHFPKLRPHVPQLLFAGDWNHRFVVFQSPVLGKAGPARFTNVHERFLNLLQSCDPSAQAGEVVVENTARKWERAARLLGNRWQSLGREVLRIASNELQGAAVCCGLHHGDFAPWNTRVEPAGLRVFDWEAAAWDAPLPWDRLHFLAQAHCVLKEKHSASELAKANTANRAIFLLYMLSSAADAAQEGTRPFAIDYREHQILRQLTEDARDCVTRRMDP
jgi:hypothetical protein